MDTVDAGVWYHVAVVDASGRPRRHEPAPPTGGEAVAPDDEHAREDAALRFSPAASAAALALALVAWNALLHPWVAPPSHADALFNEWVIWFTAWYLALVGAAALLERIRTLYRSRMPVQGARPHG
jgi:hypothetical protein